MRPELQTKPPETMPQNRMRRLQQAQLVDAQVKADPAMSWVHVDLAVCQRASDPQRDHVPQVSFINLVIKPRPLKIILHFCIVSPISCQVDLDHGTPYLEIWTPGQKQIQDELAERGCRNRRAPVQQHQATPNILYDTPSETYHVPSELQPQSHVQQRGHVFLHQDGNLGVAATDSVHVAIPNRIGPLVTSPLRQNPLTRGIR